MESNVAEEHNHHSQQQQQHQQPPQPSALIQQAIEALTRLSKGFSQILCNRQRPEIGTSPVCVSAPLLVMLHMTSLSG